MVIPPLPVVTKKMTRKVLDKREKQFQRFLQAIARSEELKSSLFLQSFLNIIDLKEWQKAIKVFEKTKFGKSLHDLVTQDGDAAVTLIQNSSVFATKMQSFADSY
jgi:phage regulator Rha-like protein